MTTDATHAFADVDVETDADGHQLVPTRARITCRCGWVTCDGEYASAADTIADMARHLDPTEEPTDG